PRIAIGSNFRALHRSVGFKHLAKFVVGRVKREVSYVQLLHDISFFRKADWAAVAYYFRARGLLAAATGLCSAARTSAGGTGWMKERGRNFGSDPTPRAVRASADFTRAARFVSSLRSVASRSPCELKGSSPLQWLILRSSRSIA